MTEPDRTPDGRHLVIDGRRWRASDPGLPEPLRVALVAELMAARRAVGTGRGDDQAVAAARRRVQDAKVALGERGHPWWEPADEDARRVRLAAALRALVHQGEEVAITEVVGVDRQERAHELAHEVASVLVDAGDLRWRSARSVGSVA